MVKEPETKKSLNVTVQHVSDGHIECSISWEKNDFQLYFTSDEELAGDYLGDALLCALLLPAMSIGTELRIDAPVSARLLENANQIQDIFHTWWNELARVPITTNSAYQSAATTDLSAAFFTGGVDSFYSAVTAEPSPAALAYVEGFDIRLGNQSLARTVKERLESCAAELDKPYRHVRTNYRDLFDMDPRFPGWPRSHGAALASIAHLLGYSTVIVPASFTYTELFPWGSHPLTDPLWSSDDVRILHHGADADRVTKCKRLGQSKAAMCHLRVCWKNPSNAYNCGRCEKCVRTMLNLHAAGVLERCGSLPQSIRPADVAKLTIHGESAITFVKQNLKVLISNGREGPKARPSTSGSGAAIPMAL